MNGGVYLKIVFWSHVRGQCGTTMHMASVAVAQALFSDSKVVMMENHDHLLNIETSLMKKTYNSEYIREKCEYNQYSLENLMEQFAAGGPVDEERLIFRCAVSFIRDRLYYLPHGYLRNRDLLDYEFSKNITGLFEGLERIFDTVYIDTFATGCLSTKAIVECADMVVVNLNQNKNVLDNFFGNFSMLRDKSLFIIGNYNPGRKFSLEQIQRKYHIPEDRLYAVPYCMEAAEAESDGSIASFIARNYIEPSIDNRDFINEIKRITATLNERSRYINYINRLHSGHYQNKVLNEYVSCQ